MPVTSSCGALGHGQVYTWGHKLVTPRRVPLAGARDTARLLSAGASASGAGASGAAGGGGPGPPGSVGATDVRFHRDRAEVRCAAR
jgi:hypothetical protein